MLNYHSTCGIVIKVQSLYHSHAHPMILSIASNSSHRLLRRIEHLVLVHTKGVLGLVEHAVAGAAVDFLILLAAKLVAEGLCRGL